MGCRRVKNEDFAKRRASPLTRNSLPANFDLSPQKSGEKLGSSEQAHYVPLTTLSLQRRQNADRRGNNLGAQAPRK
jgi:hypothetical protein